MPDTTLTSAELTRPIIGIENRTPQEVFDIMCDRISRAGLEAGKAEESMRERAADVAKWYGGEANMLQNDNVMRETHVAIRDAAYAVEAAIRALPLTGVDKP